MTQLPKFDTEVLTGIVSHLQELCSLDPMGFPYGSTERWKVNTAKQHSIVRVDLPEFLGAVPSRTQRNKAPDAYRRLEAAGYIDRLHHPGGDRTVQLRVLPAGIAKVAELLEATAGTTTQPSEVPEAGGGGSNV